jgi:hypothetical protein
MDTNHPTTAELLEVWREATRAAELAERIAEIASETARQADRNAAASEEIAKLAEGASKAAERAAQKARTAANHARRLANANRDVGLQDARAIAVSARAEEERTRNVYHAAEREARQRHPG